MWFVARCLKGLDPPLTLTPEMVPPSFRTTKPNEGLVVRYKIYYFYPYNWLLYSGKLSTEICLNKDIQERRHYYNDA